MTCTNGKKVAVISKNKIAYPEKKDVEKIIRPNERNSIAVCTYSITHGGYIT